MFQENQQSITIIATIFIAEEAKRATLVIARQYLTTTSKVHHLTECNKCFHSTTMTDNNFMLSFNHLYFHVYVKLLTNQCYL